MKTNCNPNVREKSARKGNFTIVEHERDGRLSIIKLPQFVVQVSGDCIPDKKTQLFSSPAISEHYDFYVTSRYLELENFAFQNPRLVLDPNETKEGLA